MEINSKDSYMKAVELLGGADLISTPLWWAKHWFIWKRVCQKPLFLCICADRYYKHLTMPIVSPCRLRSKGAYDGHSNKRSISYLTNAVYIIGATQYIYIVHS